MYRSNRRFNIPPPPPDLTFGKLLFKLPLPGPLKCPTLGSLKVIKCPHPGGTYKWQQIIRIQYNKNWEALLAYLLWTKVFCKAVDIAATRSLKAQSFFLCYATYKMFFKKKFTDMHHRSPMQQLKVTDLCSAFYCCIESPVYSGICNLL